MQDFCDLFYCILCFLTYQHFRARTLLIEVRENIGIGCGQRALFRDILILKFKRYEKKRDTKRQNAEGS